MKIVLVRHGFTDGNERGTYSGWSDVLLTPKGIEELLHYKKVISYPITDRYYTSDLTRTIQTFEHLYGDTQTIDASYPEFREIYFGDYEDVVGDQVPEPFFNRFFYNERVANGETFSEVNDRLIRRLTTVLLDLSKNNEESATIVCHSGVIKILDISLNHLPIDSFLNTEIDNGMGRIFDLNFNPETLEITINQTTEIKA